MAGPDVIVIGGSAGGLKALRSILEAVGTLGDTVAAVVLHRSPQDSPLVSVLQAYTGIPIGEPDDSPWACQSGRLIVAPAGYHMLLGNNRTPVVSSGSVAQYSTDSGVRAHLTLDPPVAYSRPSIDMAFASAAKLVNSVTAVLLSCANEDGVAGCEAVKAAGGHVVVQDPVTCEAPVAVAAAMRRMTPDHVAAPDDICKWLAERIVRAAAPRGDQSR